MNLIDLKTFFPDAEQRSIPLLYSEIGELEENSFVSISPKGDRAFLLSLDKGPGKAGVVQSTSTPCEAEDDNTSSIISAFCQATRFAKFAQVTQIHRSRKTIDLLLMYGFPAFSERMDERTIALPSDVSLDAFRSEFGFVAPGDQYFYVIGNPIDKKTNPCEFAFLGAENGVAKVLLQPRKKFATYDGNGKADDLVLGISSIEKLFKDEYSLSLKLCGFHFLSLRQARCADPVLDKKVQEQNLGQYLKVWEIYSNLEKEFVADEVEKAGSLKINSLQAAKGGGFTLSVQNADKIDNFVNCLRATNGTSMSVSLKGPGMRFGISARLDANPRFTSGALGQVFVNFDMDGSSIQARGNGQMELTIDTSAFDAAFKRRDAAFSRVRDGQAEMPDLSKLLDGTKNVQKAQKLKSYTPLDDETKELAFHGHDPYPNQLEAIRIALNTPDFAIIQGPPGTGKTTVISAIDKRLTMVSGDKSLRFGRNLATAYQNEATLNLSDDIEELFGMPSAVFLGHNFKTDQEERFDSWVHNQAEKIASLPENKEAMKIEKQMARYNAFVALKENYNPGVFRYSDDVNVLEQIQNDFDDCLSIGQRIEVDGLIREAKREAEKTDCDKPYDYSNYYVFAARNLPTNPASYSDKGFEQATECLLILDGANQGAQPLVKELKTIYGAKTLDFINIKKKVEELLLSLLPPRRMIAPHTFNEKIENLLSRVSDTVYKASTDNADYVIANFQEALSKGNAFVQESFGAFATSIAATHQRAVSRDVVSQKGNDTAFENVLVDEAARSCPADLIIPLSLAKERIILVGDQKQLPQFVSENINKKIIEQDGLTPTEKAVVKESMFEYLIESAKKLTALDGIKRFTVLTDEFRMPKELSDFVSDEFYGLPNDGQNGHYLVCRKQEKDCEYSLRCVLPGQKTLEQFTDISMGFINVGNSFSPVHYEKGGTSSIREDEAGVVANLIKGFLNDPQSANITFSVITFYEAQVKEIMRLLTLDGICIAENGVYRVNDSLMKGNNGLDKDRLKIGTIDSFQGKESDIVILSLVRPSSDGGKWGFVRNENRLCVALSRAKKGCFVVGNGDLLHNTSEADPIRHLVHFRNICKKGGPHVKFYDESIARQLLSSVANVK
jgi:hypothetical protein